MLKIEPMFRDFICEKTPHLSGMSPPPYSVGLCMEVPGLGHHASFSGSCQRFAKNVCVSEVEQTP